MPDGAPFAAGGFGLALGIEDRFSGPLAKFRGQITRSQAAAQALSAGLRTSAIRLGIFTVAAAGVGYAFSKAMQPGIEFERQMREVAAVTGAAGEQFQAMTGVAKRLGIETVFSAKAAAGAMYMLGSRGVKTAKDMDTLLRPSMDLAAALKFDLPAATEMTMATLKMFSLEAKDARGVVDLLTNAYRNSAANAERLAVSMRYAGFAFSTVGYTLKDTLVPLEALYDLGLEASMAGTSLRKAISSLIKPTTEAKKALAGLGLSVEDVDPRLHSFIEIVETLGKAGMGASEALAIFAQRAGPAMAKLVDLGADALRDYEEGLGTVGSAAETAREQLKGLPGALVLIKSSLEAVWIALEEFLAPALEETVLWVTENINSFLLWLESSNRMKQGIQDFMSAYGAMLRDFLKPSLRVLKDLATTVLTLVGTWSKMSEGQREFVLGGVRVGTLLATLGIAVAILGPAVLGLAKAFSILGLTTGLLNLKFFLIVAAIASLIAIGWLLRDKWSIVWESVTAAASACWQKIKNFVAWVREVGVVPAIISILHAGWDWIASVAKRFAEWVRPFIEPLIKSEPVQIVIGVVHRAWAWIVSIAQRFADWVKPYIAGLIAMEPVEVVVGLIHKAWLWMGTKAESLWAWFMEQYERGAWGKLSLGIIGITAGIALLKWTLFGVIPSLGAFLLAKLMAMGVLGAGAVLGPIGLAAAIAILLWRITPETADRFFNFWSKELPKKLAEKIKPAVIALLDVGIAIMSFKLDPIAEVNLGDFWEEKAKPALKALTPTLFLSLPLLLAIKEVILSPEVIDKLKETLSTAIATRLGPLAPILTFGPWAAGELRLEGLKEVGLQVAGRIIEAVAGGIEALREVGLGIWDLLVAVWREGLPGVIEKIRGLMEAALEPIPLSLEAAAEEVDTDALYLACIRLVENGAEGMEMGIKEYSPRFLAAVKELFGDIQEGTTEFQVAAAALSSKNYWEAFKEKFGHDADLTIADASDDVMDAFITYMGEKFAPASAHILNESWIPNMRSNFKKLRVTMKEGGYETLEEFIRALEEKAAEGVDLTAFQGALVGGIRAVQPAVSEEGSALADTFFWGGSPGGFLGGLREGLPKLDEVFQNMLSIMGDFMGKIYEYLKTVPGLGEFLGQFEELISLWQTSREEAEKLIESFVNIGEEGQNTADELTESVSRWTEEMEKVTAYLAEISQKNLQDWFQDWQGFLGQVLDIHFDSLSDFQDFWDSLSEATRDALQEQYDFWKDFIELRRAAELSFRDEMARLRGDETALLEIEIEKRIIQYKKEGWTEVEIQTWVKEFRARKEEELTEKLKEEVQKRIATDEEAAGLSLAAFMGACLEVIELGKEAEATYEKFDELFLLMAAGFRTAEEVAAAMGESVYHYMKVMLGEWSNAAELVNLIRDAWLYAMGEMDEAARLTFLNTIRHLGDVQQHTSLMKEGLEDVVLYLRTAFPNQFAQMVKEIKILSKEGGEFLWRQFYESFEKIQKFWASATKSIRGSFETLVADILEGTKTMEEIWLDFTLAIKKGMIDALAKALVEKMMFDIQIEANLLQWEGDWESLAEHIRTSLAAALGTISERAKTLIPIAQELAKIFEKIFSAALPAVPQSSSFSTGALFPRGLETFQAGAVFRKPTAFVGIAGEGGEAEILAPESTIRRIVREEMGERQSVYNFGPVEFQFPNVTSFQDWFDASPATIKAVIERKFFPAFRSCIRESKLSESVFP